AVDAGGDVRLVVGDAQRRTLAADDGCRVRDEGERFRQDHEQNLSDRGAARNRPGREIADAAEASPERRTPSRSRGAASAMLVVSRLASGWITTGERPTTEFDRAPGPIGTPFRIRL